MSTSLLRCKKCNSPLPLCGDPDGAANIGLCTQCFQLKSLRSNSQQENETFVDTYDKYFIVLFAFVFVIPVYDFLVTQELPWAYFQFLRIVAFIGFGYLSYRCMSEKKEEDSSLWFFVFLGFAILYNPFFQVSLGSRDAWSGANFLSAATLLWYAFGPNLDDPKPPQENVYSTKSESFSEPRIERNIPDERRAELFSLIAPPLGMQVVFITARDEGVAYLGSDHAIGFVAGFTDTFIQLLDTPSPVTDRDAISIVTVVLNSVLEPAKINAGRLFTLRDSGDPDFLEAVEEGGLYAAKLLNDPTNAELQMYWVTLVDEWIENNAIVNTTLKQSLLREYQEFNSACTLLEYDEEIYQMAEELYLINSRWCSEFVESLDAKPKQNPTSLFLEIKAKIETQLSPFEDEDANSALAEAREISMAAHEEFIKVYELLGDRLKPEEILEKVQSKYR